MPTYIKRGDKWRVQVRRKGVSKSGTFHTKAEGREWATKVERQIDTGRHRKQSTATLEDVFKRYAEEISPTKRGERWEKVRLAKLQADPIADKRLCDLTPGDFTKWRDRRAGEVSAGTVNRELTLIRSTMKAARVLWGWIDSDPMKDVSRMPAPPARDRRISDDEITRMCWALGFTGEAKNHSQQVAVMFLLAIETGMRLGEICAIEPQDIKGRFVRLHRTKNADRRDVPLSREARRLIGLVDRFTVNPGTASQLFRKARIRASIKNLTFHDSRHEACTRLARKLDILDLARMLGHRDLRSLRVYYNASADEISMRLDAADAPTSSLHPETSADTPMAGLVSGNPPGK